MVQPPFGRQFFFFFFFYKTKHTIQFLLVPVDIYPKELKANAYTETCPWMLIHSGIDKAMETIKRSVERRERRVGRTKRIFRAVKNNLYIVMMNICHYTFVKTHRMYNMKSEP